MKANEAPEKLYIDLFKGEFNVSYSPINNSVEYTRTDAFIERAAAWLKEHKEAVETEDNGIMGWIPDYFIKDFVNYMKGE